MRNVDTIFALEFGQLLENHLFASPNRDAELEIIISSLNLQITGRNWEDSTTLRPDRISLTNEPSDARSAATEEWGDDFGDIDFSNL